MRKYKILKNQLFKNKTREQGITVISLIISIVIIAIISAVIIKSSLNDEKTIDHTLDVAEEYAVANYKEQVSELIETIIKKNEIAGDETGLQQIASEINNETWIKSAVAGQDIIITTENGYVFEAYYSEEYGKRFVEYIGKETSGIIPNITATYDNQTQNIAVTSNDTKTLELSYNGEKVKTSNSTSLSYLAKKKGWYTARAISNSGNARYAWIKVAGNDLSINLEVTSVGILENGWYGQDNVPVEVKISTNGNKIYYKLGTAEEYTEIDENTTTVEINTVGKTTIYAYAADGSGNESDVSKIKIRYDNTKPIIGEISINGTQGFKDWYTSDITISLPNITDEESGIDGYYYWEVNNQESVNGFLKGSSKTITVSSIGTKKLAFQAKDKAGNLSEIQTITVKKIKVLQPGEMAEDENALYKNIIIPAGFTVSNIPGEYENVDNGVVVYDIPKSDLTNATSTFWTDKGDNDYLNVQENYNQFVWVPVEKAYIEANENITTYTGATTPVYPMAVKLSDGNYRGILYDFGKSGDNVSITSKEYNSNASGSYDYNVSGYNQYYREPGMLKPDYNNGTPKYSISQTSLQTEYNEMVKSVEEYGGFFVARYELSYNNKGESKRNKIVTTASDDNTPMWYGLYDTCKAMYNNSNSYNVQSMMITGAQYDHILTWMKDVPNGSKKYVLDSSDMGNNGTFASVRNSGYSDNYSVKGIFDLAGNLEEWTSEAYDELAYNARVARGGRKGRSGSTYPVSDRVKSSNPTFKTVDDYRSSRSTLYIKVEE